MPHPPFGGLYCSIWLRYGDKPPFCYYGLRVCYRNSFIGTRRTTCPQALPWKAAELRDGFEARRARPREALTSLVLKEANGPLVTSHLLCGVGSRPDVATLRGAGPPSPVLPSSCNPGLDSTRSLLELARHRRPGGLGKSAGSESVGVGVRVPPRRLPCGAAGAGLRAPLLTAPHQKWGGASTPVTSRGLCVLAWWLVGAAGVYVTRNVRGGMPRLHGHVTQPRTASDST